jgi:hypothetical protein
LESFKKIAKSGPQGLTHIKLTFLYGEFDSGSERTLAAWIRHASRALITG